MSLPIYCPRCGSLLSNKYEGGKQRPACDSPGCGYFHFTDVSIGCGAVVIHEGRALLIQRGLEPGRGNWQIPGGYAEHDENISLAVEREIEEEAGIVAKVSDVLAFRHSIGGGAGGPSTNMYVVFRLNLVSGEPVYDGDEIADAGFFSLEEMESMESVQGLSKWAISKALNSKPGSGLVLDHGEVGSIRPGWQVFGLLENLQND